MTRQFPRNAFNFNGTIACTFFALLASLLLALPAQGQAYTATKVTIPGSVMFINASGEVAASYEFRGRKGGPIGCCRAFFWSESSGMIDLGDLGGGASGVYAINDSGQVTGWSVVMPDLVHAFLWSQATGMQDLGLALPTDTGIQGGVQGGINNSGQVVGVYSLSGQSYPGGPWHAYLWSQSAGLQDLGTLDGPSASSSATAINNNGQVVGSTDSPDCPNGSPFLWTAPTGMQLTLGCTPVIPTSINDDGQTVGQVVDPSGTFFDVVLWSPTEGVQILGPGVQVPWWPGEPAISDNGQVVGTAYQPSDNGDLPFMWSSETGTQYLNNLVPRGVSINYAGSINQLGQIIAWGNRFSYLLTPKMYTTLTSSLNPSYAGQSVTFTGTVSSIASPPPDGELVSFSEHGTPLGSAPLIGGVATFTTSSLPVGVLHIEATYVGDGTFEPSRPGKLKQVVKK